MLSVIMMHVILMSVVLSSVVVPFSCNGSCSMENIEMEKKQKNGVSLLKKCRKTRPHYPIGEIQNQGAIL
jgi:hypothetical protein